MDPYTFFKELPNSVAVPVLATWICTEDLSRLDVAFCSHNQRGHLLQLLADDGFTTRGIDYIPRNLEDNYFRWLCSRKVKVRFVTIRDASTYLLMTEERDLLPLCKRLSCLELSSHWYNREPNPSKCPLLLQRMMDLVSCCSHLKILSISNCDELTGDMVPHLARNCPLLESLDLSHSPGIKRIELDPSSRFVFEKLKCLNLYNCPSLDRPSMENFVSHCKQLQYLNLSGCIKLRDHTLQTILKSCTQLRNLNVRYCRQLTDEAIYSIADECSFRGHLQHINIGGCMQVTDAAAIYLVERLGTYLQAIEVVGCSCLTDKFMVAVSEHCSSLRHLKICNCCHITTHGALLVLDRCLELELLNANFCIKVKEEEVMIQKRRLLEESGRAVEILKD